MKQLCLTLWNRSPQCYSFLRNSGFLILPSDSLLERYKKVIDQGPGLKDQLLEWMYNNANEAGVNKSGGIVFDEMSIQEDIQMIRHGLESEYTGFVDMGKESQCMRLLSSGSTTLPMATHMLQFIFLSFDGFRWPFAFFPTNGAREPELFLNFWKAVSMLSVFGFRVEYACMDGASSNRAFLKMHSVSNFTVPNMCYPERQVTFLMDYSHVIKRIRNNISSSGDGKMQTSKLTHQGRVITWDHFLRAFMWDREVNPMRIHRKLTDEHMFLTNTAKMRNHLAEQVLDEDMLNLLIQFQKVLGDEGEDLAGSIELLHNTSLLVKFFRDDRPIKLADDPRLKQLMNIQSWFLDWEVMVSALDKSPSEKKAMLMTQETREDVQCVLTGFIEICQRVLKGTQSVTPAGINSDIVENFFSQQRAQRHGTTTNPNAFQYQHGVNSCILQQTMVSKKSNAATSYRSSRANPFSFTSNIPLNTRRSSIHTLSSQPEGNLKLFILSHNT